MTIDEISTEVEISDHLGHLVAQVRDAHYQGADTTNPQMIHQQMITHIIEFVD